MRIKNNKKWIFLNWLVFIIADCLFSLIGLVARDSWSSSAIIWLPSGLLLGILCTTSRLQWPLYILSAEAINLLTSSYFGRGLDISITYIFIELMTVIPLAIMWKKNVANFSDFPGKKIILLALASVYIVNIIGGVASVIMLKLLAHPIGILKFYIWSSANALGCISLAPIFIFRNLAEKSSLSILKKSFAILLCCTFLLPGYFFEEMFVKQAVLYFVMIGVLAMSLTLSLRQLAVYLFIFTITINLTTLFGYGPFSIGGTQGVEFAQLYILSIITISLLLNSHEGKNKIRQDALKLQLLEKNLEKHCPAFFYLSGNLEDIRWLDKMPVFGIPADKLPTILQIQLYIHPEDRACFELLLSKINSNCGNILQCSFRLLINNSNYHNIRCHIIQKHTPLGFFGLLIPENEIKSH